MTGPFYGFMMVPEKGYANFYSRYMSDEKFEQLVVFANSCSLALGPEAIAMVDNHANHLERHFRVPYRRALPQAILIHMSANETRFPI